MRTFDEISLRLTNPRSCGNSIRSTCPLCYGQHLSLTRFPDGGACLKCFSCSATMSELFVALGSKPEPMTARRLSLKEVSDQERISRALAIWREAKPIESSPASIYLAGRRITDSLPKTLRYHPALWHAETNRNYPAMVAAVCKRDRTLTGVHCTFLNFLGQGKLNVEPNKKMFGVVRGRSVHLAAIEGDTMAICEGIETGLSFQILCGVPTWAALSTSGLLTFEPPTGIKRIVIAGDSDPDSTGQAAAAEAADRIEDLYPEIETTLQLPDDGTDWNDALRVSTTDETQRRTTFRTRSRFRAWLSCSPPYVQKTSDRLFAYL